MTAWLSILVPLLVMFFALGMERVEARLRESSVRQDELDDFLERARADEVKALFRSGIGRALELFRRRNRNDRTAGRNQRRTERRDRVAS
ncbi:MAG: hypothetical protein H0V92_06015 [Pseudonocardiales bacterium]|nr:hypothetical protein [Pseudonocardiales bacterium]